MILTLTGLILSFIGAFAIIIETISGSYIRPKIYYFVLKGVHEYNIHDKIVKIKLRAQEIRILIWIIFIAIGFLLQILDFPFIKNWLLDFYTRIGF
jgi:hypothetical protein